MALSTRLDLRQTQSLVMTPQLQQAIKLLQLSNVELSTYLEEELERNPLLERDDGGEGEATERAEEAAPDSGGDESTGADEASLDATGPDEASTRASTPWSASLLAITRRAVFASSSASSSDCVR